MAGLGASDARDVDKAQHVGMDLTTSSSTSRKPDCQRRPTEPYKNFRRTDPRNGKANKVLQIRYGPLRMIEEGASFVDI